MLLRHITVEYRGPFDAAQEANKINLTQTRSGSDTETENSSLKG